MSDMFEERLDRYLESDLKKMTRYLAELNETLHEAMRAEYPAQVLDPMMAPCEIRDGLRLRAQTRKMCCLKTADFVAAADKHPGDFRERIEKQLYEALLRTLEPLISKGLTVSFFLPVNGGGWMLGGEEFLVTTRFATPKEQE